MCFEFFLLSNLYAVSQCNFLGLEIHVCVIQDSQTGLYIYAGRPVFIFLPHSSASLIYFLSIRPLVLKNMPNNYYKLRFQISRFKQLFFK